MNVRGRRIFNRRPVCFFALTLAAGILVAEAFYPVPHLYRLIPLTLCVGICACFAVFGRLRKYLYIAAAFLIGFLSCTGAADIADSRLVPDGEGVFTARVASEITVKDGSAWFYVEDLTLGDRTLEGRVYVTARLDAPDFGAGDIVLLEGHLSAEKHEAFDTYYASAVLDRCYFELRNADVSYLAHGDPDIVLSVRLAISRLYHEHMDEDAAVIARALIIGDTSGMDEGLYDDITDSGLVHVLSVSGLHITALATAVYWVFRKLGINSKIALVVVLALGLFYVAVCDFVPPAVRALVMTAVFNFGSAFGFKRDGLSALAFAASAIMIFSPFSLMHVGFLLSVFSILGIMLFAESFKKFFMKGVDRVAPSRLALSPSDKFGTVASIQAGAVPEDDPLEKLIAEKTAEEKTARPKPKTPRETPLRRLLVYASDSASVSVAANLTAMPIAAYFFGKIQTLFIISNIVILPYTMFIYLFLLVVTPFSLISGLHGLVGSVDYLVMPFTGFVRAIGEISFASVPLAISLTGMIAVLIAEVALSRFVFLKRMEKAVAVIAVATAFLVISACVLLV